MNVSNMYPKKGITKRTALGGFWTLLGHGIKALEQIILVPLFLWAWSKALYGEWMTLFSIVGYLSISELGMGRYVINRMIKAYSKSNIEEYIKTFKSAIGIYSIISTFFLIILALFSFTTPFLDWFNIESAEPFSVRLSLFILGLYIILGTLAGMANAFHITTGDYPRNRLFMNIREFLLIAFVVLVLVSGGMFVGVALVYLFLLLGFSIFVFFDAKKRHPEIDFKKSKIDWKLGKSFIIPGLVFFAIPFSNMIYLQGSVLIIGAILGSTAVAVFSIHRTLANLIQKFTSTINPAISPELTAGEERKEYSKIQIIHRFFTKVTLFISLSLSICLLFFGEEIMQVWTGGEIVFDSQLWIIFLILIPVIAFWNFSSIFQVSTNKYNKLALSRIISTVLGLILAIILIKPLGLVGVLLGFLISEVLIDFWYIPYNTIKIIKDSKKKFVVSVLGVLPMVTFQLIFGWLVSALFENVWLKIISVGLVVVGIGALYLHFFWFNKEEKAIADNFITRAKKKFVN